MSYYVLVYAKTLIINYLLGNGMFPTVAKLYKEEPKADNGKR
jgi:hypothetical protein